MTAGIIYKRALADLKQNFTTQLMTTLVVTLSILLLTFFAMFSFNFKHFVEELGSKLGIIIYLKKEVPQEAIPSLYRKISELKGIESVNYTSSEDAFMKLQKYLAREQQVLEGVDANFLPPSFEIQINRAVFNIERIREVAAELSRWKEVSKVQYGEDWIDRLEIFSGITQKTVLGTGLLLLITTAFVVANTIKLTIYARQEELEILRLVGATNGFIAGPFLVEAMLQGLAGSILATGIVFATYQYLQGLMSQHPLFREVDLVFLPMPYLLAIIGGSILVCVAGTAVSMRKFLKL